MNLGQGLYIGAGGRRRPGTPGDFSSRLSGLYHYWQPDRGATYASALRPQGTAPPAITATWGFTGRQVPVQVKCTFAGVLGAWTGTYSFDGGSTTTAFASAATVNLTGAGSGVVLTIPAGTASTDNQWDAVVSKLTDLSGHGVDLLFGAGHGAIVTKGTNGKLGVKSNAVDIYGTYTQIYPAPATTPLFWLICWRFIGANTTAAGALFSDRSATQLINYQLQNSNSNVMYDGSNGPALTLVNGVWGRHAQLFTGSTNDRQKFGGNPATWTASGTSSGNSAGTNARGFFATSDGVDPINAEMVFAIATNNDPGATVLAQIDADITSYYAGTIGV